MNPDAIPQELRERDQWICWKEETRDGNTTKIPKRPDNSGRNAKANDNQTWGSLEDAIRVAEQNDWGVGFVFSAADPYVAIDIDGCIYQDDNGRRRPEDWLPKLDAFKDSYVEVSPSGNGLHIILKEADVPEWWTNQIVHQDKDPDAYSEFDVHNDNGEVEIAVFEAGRFFTFTGDTLEGFETTTIEPLDGLHEWLSAGYLAFNDSLPFETGEHDDVDISVYDVISRSQHPPGERTEHPVHGSSTGANFMVDEGGETWRCWSSGHKCTGDGLHLLGMKMGAIECGQWKHGEISAETWREIFNKAREQGLIDDDRDQDHDPDETRESSSDDGERLDDATHIWNDIRTDYQEAEDSDVKAHLRYRITKLLTKLQSFRTHENRDSIHHWNQSTGVYEPRGKEVIKKILVRHLNHHYSRFAYNEIMDQIKGRSYTRGHEFGGPAHKINLKNGVLDLQDLELEDHAPDYLFLSGLPVEYDPDADAPRWREFLDRVIDDEIDRKKVQEFAGYCLMHWDLPYHKSLFIVGPQASGKSTFLDVIRGLLGPDTVSSVTPQELVEERFSAVELYGAWANIRNDIPSGLIQNTGKYKELVSGDPIKAEDKYESTFTFSPTAKHLYSANQLPDASVDDDAFYRRIMLVQFPHTIPINERESNLAETIINEELSGVLNWAIEGYQRLVDQDEFTGARNPSKVRETWETWGSTVDRWRQECIQFEPDAWVPKETAHQSYTAFCEDRGLPAGKSQNKFTRSLKRHKDITDGRKYSSEDGKQIRCFYGFNILDEWQPDDADQDDVDVIGDDDLDVDLDRFGTST